MKAIIWSAVVWLLSSLWTSAGCFLINDTYRNTTETNNDVTAMAVSKYNDTSNCSYMVVGVNDYRVLLVYRMTQSKAEAGLPLFNLIYPPYQVFVPFEGASRLLQGAPSPCTITSTIYHIMTDKFLIAVNCVDSSFGGPPISGLYLHTMADYSSNSINFAYNTNANLRSYGSGIGPITRIVPLPNGKVITCPNLAIFYLNQGNSTFSVDKIMLPRGSFDCLACIDNTNCMAGNRNSTSLSIFNPSGTLIDYIAQIPLSSSLVGISMFNTTQVYFVALFDGTYNLYNMLGQLMVSSPNTIFGLPLNSSIFYSLLQSTQIKGKDMILVSGTYRGSMIVQIYTAFVAGLTVLSTDNNKIEIDIAFSYNTTADTPDVFQNIGYSNDSKFIATCDPYPLTIINAYTKLLCHASCLTCASVSADKCYTCQPNYIWHDGGIIFKRTKYSQVGRCIDSCPEEYSLINGTCGKQPTTTQPELPATTQPELPTTTQVVLKASMNEHKSTTVDISILAIVEQPANISMYPNLLTDIKQRMPGSLVFYDLEMRYVEQVAANYYIFTTQGYIIIDVMLKEPLNGHEYRLNWILRESVTFASDQTSFAMDVFNMSFKYTNPSATPRELENVNQQGSAVGGMIALVAVKSPAIQETINGLAAADPTGLSIRFAQILRIVGRMVYFNVYFGDRFAAFLDSIEKYALTRYSIDKNELVRISKGWMGKLSTRGVEANFFMLHWKLILYTLGWVFRLASGMCNHFQLKVRRVGLIAIFYVPCINLFLLNLVLIDFAFHGSHSALHFTLITSTTIACIFLSLLVADLLLLLNWIFNDSAWHLGLQRLTRGMQKPEAPTISQDSSVDCSLSPSKTTNVSNVETSKNGNRSLENSIVDIARDTNESDPSKKPINNKQIDYPASYRYATSGIHQIRMLSGSLRLDAKVFDCNLSRSLFIVHCTRIFAYQSFIAAGQQLTGLVASILLLTELARIILVVYIQRKTKPFRNCFYLTAELTQSICLIALLALILSLPRSKYESKVGGGIQTLGIAIVFIAVLLEYICLIGQILCLVVKKIKARQQKDKSKRDKGLKDDQIQKISEIKIGRFDWYVRYVMPVAASKTGKTAVGQKQALALSRPRKLVNDANKRAKLSNNRNSNISGVPIQDSTVNEEEDGRTIKVKASGINRISSAILNGKHRLQIPVSRSLSKSVYRGRYRSYVISPSIRAPPSMNNATPVQDPAMH